jgi:outer membrane receptor for ferrienterochelin and colicin
MKPKSQTKNPLDIWPRRIALAIALGGVFLAHRSALSQEVTAEDVSLAPVTVVGDAMNIRNIAGSAALIDQQQIQRQN